MNLTNMMINFEFEKKLVKKLAEMPRHLISPAITDSLDLLDDFARDKGLEVIRHNFKSGFDYGTWKIPNQWSPISAKIKTISGEMVLNCSDPKLDIISYSLPFTGIVSKQDLFNHLYFSEHAKEAVPFIFKYHKRDWGLAVNKKFIDSLKEDQYYIEIKINEVPGNLEVLEISRCGLSENSFLLCCHICHPFQINDGPIAAPFFIRLLSELTEIPNYTFKILIVPELIGSAAWINENLKKAKKIQAGLFVEMIGTNLNQRLNKSFEGNTLVDKFFEQTLKKIDPNIIIDDFNYANDERNFNGPGLGIPVCGLTRSYMSRTMKVNYAFENYHTSFDNYENINWENLYKSYECIKTLIYNFDRYMCVPKNNFTGEPFLTKFGLHIDVFAKDVILSEIMHKSNLLMDHIFLTGKGFKIIEIAQKLNVDPEVSAKIFEKLVKSGLVSYE